jgi:methylsterol monooxygenase
MFIRRDKWTEKAKSRAASYTWGGNLEQKLVAEMRKQSARLINDTHDLS